MNAAYGLSASTAADAPSWNPCARASHPEKTMIVVVYSLADPRTCLPTCKSSSRDSFAIASPLGQIRDSEGSDETTLHGCSSHRSEPTNNRAPAADRLRGLVSLKRQLPTAAASKEASLLEVRGSPLNSALS